MREKRIKIKSHIPFWLPICLIVILVIALISFFITTRFHHNYSELFCILPMLILSAFAEVSNKEQYLSDIYITEEEIKLVYKRKNKITKTEVLKKDNIKTFKLDAYIYDVKILIKSSASL